MSFIKKNKTSLVVGIICIIVVVLISLAIYRMFYPSNDSIYGDRLDNAPEIDNAVIEQIKTKMLDTGLIENVEYETNVATMKFFVSVSDNTKLEEAQKLGDIILDTLSTKIINFYDIEVFLTNENNEQYPSIGYHSKSASLFSWINNVGEADEE